MARGASEDERMNQSPVQRATRAANRAAERDKQRGAEAGRPTKIRKRPDKKSQPGRTPGTERNVRDEQP